MRSMRTQRTILYRSFTPVGVVAASFVFVFDGLTFPSAPPPQYKPKLKAIAPTSAPTTTLVVVTLWPKKCSSADESMVPTEKTKLRSCSKRKHKNTLGETRIKKRMRCRKERKKEGRVSVPRARATLLPLNTPPELTPTLCASKGFSLSLSFSFFFSPPQMDVSIVFSSRRYVK